MARVSEDDRGSPMPRNPRESPYHNLPQYREAPSPNYPDHTGVDDSFGPRYVTSWIIYGAGML